MQTLPIRFQLKHKIEIVLTAALLAFSLRAPAQTLPNGAVDTGDSHDGQKLIVTESPQAVKQRLAWWEDARFGMFIHWGLYSQWGCHYPSTNGTMLNGQSEHMMQHLKMPLAQYAKIADLFDPTNFNADEWVSIAKNAGMKYIVITAKHHDGFAMFNSPSSDYNIVKRTPWKRDPIKELAEACRKQGLKFCVYYSLGRDWQDPDVPTKNGYRSNTWDYPNESKKDFSKYFERKVKPQVTELLTQYGPIGIMWFDTPEMISKAESQELVRLIHKLQPECIINARVGNRLGDYAVQEQKIPAGGDPQPWETCMTLNKHWGYFLGDKNWKPAKTVIQNLVDIVSKGGNYLLNVGPTGQGVIPEGAVNDLQQVGAWMKVNGESIYGTKASPLKAQPSWGRATRKGDTVYLHVFDWPQDGKLSVEGPKGPVKSAYLLADPEKKQLKFSTPGWTNYGGGGVIELPEKPLDPIDTVVVLKFGSAESVMSK